jgi:hypothetical protein
MSYKKIAKAARPINPDHLKRASKVEDHLIGPYLDEILTTMHQSLDGWRFGKTSSEPLQLATDAFIALLTEAENRGLT